MWKWRTGPFRSVTSPANRRQYEQDEQDSPVIPAKERHPCHFLICFSVLIAALACSGRCIDSTYQGHHDAYMRTTLTIDPDVERLLQREMRRTDRSMKAVVNDALRVGLGAQGKTLRLPPFKVESHAFHFKPGVDVDRLNQLVDELEAEALSRKLER